MFRRRKQPEPSRTGQLVEQSRQIARGLSSAADLDALIAAIGDARCVMLGEASHGTSEYYAWRARISQRLIKEKGFSFIAVEGDWPDCYQVNRYVKGYPNSGESAYEVLNAYERWPTWMWANQEIVALAEWLRSHNRQAERKVGFYGLDVYSLWESMHSVVKYMQNQYPDLAHLAMQAYRCFEPYAEDVQSYAWSTRMVPDTCEDEVVDLLRQVRQRPPLLDSDPEAAFNTEQNALVMVNAERYYRAMVSSDQNSWNVRDRHMMDTLDRLMQYHRNDSRAAKAIVWAHNTHIGDARYTDMVLDGTVNIGQLARQQMGPEHVFLVGFGSHHGTVIAAEAWDAPMQVMGVPDAAEGSWEDVLHRTGKESLLMLLRDVRDRELFEEERGHRAIGVVYNPERERYGNYVPTNLPRRYDAFFFVDETRALHPLHIKAREEALIPETYPWGL